MLPHIQPRDLEWWISQFKKILDDQITDFNDRAEYFSDFYKLLIDIEDGVKERFELMQFLKSILHNEHFFLYDGVNIRLGKDLTCKYSFLRKQLYLSLFAMIGGVYDSSARLCMLGLDKDGGIKNDCHIQNIFFGNDRMTRGHQDVLGPLKRDYGYFLGVIIFLRNLFIHRGESIFGGKPLFKSNVCRDIDSLNPDVLTEIENEAHDRYEVKKYRNNELQLFTFKHKPLIELVNIYLLYADHSIGKVINSLVGKHVGVV